MSVENWMVPDRNIINGNPMASFNHLNYDYQVIFQLSDDVILTENSASLASKHPDKTLIIYYDIDENKSRVVHGSPDKLQGDRVRWILNGHGNNITHTFDNIKAESLYAIVDYLKLSRDMVSPERVILFSCRLGIDPYDGIKDHFALEYAEIMQRNKDKTSLRAYNKIVGTMEEEYVGVKDFGRRYTKTDDKKEWFFKNLKHRVDYRIHSDDQLFINDTPMATYILQDIAEGRISAVEAAKKYKKHLLYYITADSNGRIDPNRLSQLAKVPPELLRFVPNAAHNNTGERVEIAGGDNSSPPFRLNEKKPNVVNLYDDISDDVNNNNKLSETSQHELSSLKDNMTKNELSPHGNKRLSKIANNIGRSYQVFCIFLLGMSTSAMLKRLNSSGISEQEKKEIIDALALSWSEFSVDFGIDVMQPSFEKVASSLAKKIPMAKGVSQIPLRAGSVVAKAAGPALNIASAGFDIYNVVKVYEQLEKETDPDNARGLIINGTLSALGAGVGILTAAALAVGLSVAGPLGMIAGIGIALATMIFNAASTIAKIKEHIDLRGLDEINNGIGLMFGAKLDPFTQARLDAKQQRILREHIDRYATEIANNQLTHSGVTKYYYVYDKYGEVKERQYYYINKEKNDYFLNIFNSNDNNFIRRGDDFINVITREHISEKTYKGYWTKCSYKEYEEYRNNKKFVVETRLDDTFGVSGDTNVAIIIDKEYFNDKFPDGHIGRDKIIALDKTRAKNVGYLGVNSSANKKVHFNMGIGNSYVFADRHTQNSFDITQGIKVFVGGDLDDMFYLRGHELGRTDQRSQLDGRKGEDILAIMGVYRGGVIGYKINLMAGTVHYHYKEIYLTNASERGLLMNVANIEHIFSAEDTDDVLTGDDKANVLKGMGGWDILKGHGGDDMLSLQSGEAYGGAGLDNYKILQNKQNNSVSVALFEQPGNEVSHVILDYALQKIDDIYLLGNDVHIMLRNDNNTLTTLMLKSVYSEMSHDGKEKNNDFIFYTKDGFILEPQWQKTLASESSHSDSVFNPTLRAYQFSNKSSFLSNVKNSIPSAFISKKNGVNIVKVDNINVVLKNFIDPMLIGHDFSLDTLEGSAQDDLFSHLGAGDEIYVSQGNDAYIIDTMMLPEKNQHDTLTLSNNGKHDWTTDQEQIFILNDISGDDLQITLNTFNGVQEAIISHKQLPDDYLKIKLPMPEEGNLVYNQFCVVDKDKKRFIVRYNFLEAVISPEIPEHSDSTPWKGNYRISNFNTSKDDGLAVSEDNGVSQLTNDISGILSEETKNPYLSNLIKFPSKSSDLPPVVAAQ